MWYLKTNRRTKVFELVGRRALTIGEHTPSIELDAHTPKKTMSSLSRHDDDSNAGDVAPEPQTADRPLTNIDMADAMGETTVLSNANLPRTKQVHLRWMSTAPVAAFRNGRTTTIYPVLEAKDNWMDIMLSRQLVSCRP
jgi:hypothetical protein